MLKSIVISVILIFLASVSANALEVTVRNITTDPATYLESNEEAMNNRICFLVKVDEKDFSRNCARLKSSKGSTWPQDEYIIFESSKLTPNYQTDDVGSNGSKFWLRKFKNNDTGNFEAFIKQFSRKEQAIFGGMCKKFSSKSFLNNYFLKPFDSGYFSRVSKASVDKFDRNKAVSGFANIGKRCLATIESIAGSIKLVDLDNLKICDLKLSKGWAGKNTLNTEKYKSLQRGLENAGFYNKAIDGDFGKGSCAALQKYMEAENYFNSSVLTKELHDKLVKLGTPPSSLTFESVSLRPFDGRRGNRGTWLGSKIILVGTRIDGIPFKQFIEFEISGNFDSEDRTVENIGFEQGKTFKILPSEVAERDNTIWLSGKYTTKTQINRLFKAISREDKIIMKGICGLVSSENFSRSIIDDLSKVPPNSYRDYKDNKFNQYWSDPFGPKELREIGQHCNNSINNIGAERISFKMVAEVKQETKTAERDECTPLEVLEKNLLAEIKALNSCKQDSIKIQDSIDFGKKLLSKISGLADPLDLCKVEFSPLKSDLNRFLANNGKSESLDQFCESGSTTNEVDEALKPVFEGLQAQISELKKIKISPANIQIMEDELKELDREMGQSIILLGEEKNIRISEPEIEELQKKITNLSALISEKLMIIEEKNLVRKSLEIYSSNEQVSILNNLQSEIVVLKNEKDILTKKILDAQKKVDAAKASVIGLDIQAEKVVTKINSTMAIVDATSMTADEINEEAKTLSGEVAVLELELSAMKEKSESYKISREKLQGNLTKNKERNDAIELKVSELEETISISEDTIADLSPKVEANEQIVTSLQDSIERDYISKENFLIGQALLNELTTGVTAVQEEKLELQGFLNEIRTEEMRLFELCNKDKKCRNAMADRMGMD